jgi:hypothetical protein
MAKFKMGPLVTDGDVFTARLGATADAAGRFADTETGKFVKLAGDSRFVLASAGDKIEGVVVAVEKATLDGYSIGAVQSQGRLAVVLDGLEATPGTGAIAIGDYVVVGTVVAKDTALSADPKVTKATNQPGTAVVSTVGAADTAAAIKTQIDAALVKVADAQKNVMFAWRLVSASGTAVGSTGVIERVEA